MTVPYKKAPANFVPAAAVIRGVLALSGFTGRKGVRRRFNKLYVKYLSLTKKMHPKLLK